MDKFTFKTADGVDVNIEKLSRAFPEVITETMGEDGKIKRVVDFKKLKMILGDSAATKAQEFYEFTWPGKNEAIMEAAKSTTKTLRPCPEESKNWDTTQNLYIEGDNLEVLKLLQESYLCKVKMIYIDPPYNTGKDFVYRDNFHKSAKDAKEDETARDEETDNNLFQNTESNGRFHSDWCSMIYPRLKLARDLLSDDGVIFISIDDNEVTNLRKICDEIFGERNFIANICHKNRDGVSNDKIISNNHNLILFYAKEYNLIHANRENFGILRSSSDFKNYNRNDNDGKGDYTLNPVTGPGGARKGNPYYEALGITNYWRFSKERMLKMINDGIVIKVNNNLYQKTYKKDLLGTKKGATTWWEVGTTAQGSKQLKELFGEAIFDFSKPESLLSFMMQFIDLRKEDLILDFFSGSATTAHACMQLNAEDGGNRKFIMVQLPEVCAPESEAAKAGYKNICEIGKERIRRAGEKIKAEHATTAPNLDIGFRVLKLDESNMKEVYYKPDELSQDMLSGLESNIKEDRNDLDLLYACLIDWGVELALPLKTEEINGVKVYTVNDSEIPDLIACFSENIPETTIREIAKRKPLRVVFRDSSFADSPSKINVTEIFKNFSPNTTIKVL